MSRIEQNHKLLFECQEKSVRMENEEWTEEQIQQRCAELRNHIVDAESVNNRFRNPALHKIWNSPPRIKRI